MLAQQTEKVTEIEGITEYRLDNGARILLFPDNSKPEFTLNVTVMVGSRHEGYGESGMAHLLEHMLFKGTATHPDIPKFLKDRGVLNMNGTTSIDRTNYYETLPASDENLEFAIRMEADRLVNSLIRGEDLASEMTVVRNEFERGENSPQAILMQRITATAYEWHNYGKSTIGNRSDIERVPVTNLREFYRKFYQPDNILIVLAGKFDEAKAKQYLAKYFGSLEQPQRELPQTYTEEPAQDGERLVMLRRVGSTQLVGVAYHIVSAADPDFAAFQVLTTILSNEPSGPLYNSIVKTKIASSAVAFARPSHDPGLLMALAEVPEGGDLDKARNALIAEIEEIGNVGTDSESVKRAIQKLRSGRERQFAQSSSFALGLSNWQAYGDWRLYFLHRDRVDKVTTEDVKRVAKRYLVESNRTVGLFVPTTEPVRAPIPTAPKIDSMLANYKGRKKMEMGEAFEPTPANIEARTTKGKLSSGMQYALLPKKTRGSRVNLSGQIHFGNVSNLKGLSTASEFVPSLLTRGTKSYDFQQFSDKLDELNTRLSFSGGPGILNFSLETKRENLAEALDLMRSAMREPLLADDQLEVTKRSRLTRMESMSTDPQMLAIVKSQQKISPYEKGDVRYIATLAEDMEMIEALTIEDIRKVYNEYLNGNHGEIAVVGDFDAEQVLEKLEGIFADWNAKQPYERMPRTVVDKFDGERIVINTPDKKNAVYIAAVPLTMRDDDPDFEPLLIGNYIMGGGPLSSRLADRVRKKDGLSYGVGSAMRSNHIHERGIEQIFAISNPQNMARVVTAIREEIVRLRESGVSNGRIAKSKRKLLAKSQRRTGSRLTVGPATGHQPGRRPFDGSSTGK